MMDPTPAIQHARHLVCQHLEGSCRFHQTSRLCTVARPVSGESRRFGKGGEIGEDRIGWR